MMVLSNAERQRRYRAKREALARGEMLADQVRALMLDVVWIAAKFDGYILGPDDEPCTVEAWVDLLSDPKVIKTNGDPKIVLASIASELLNDDLSADDRVTVERARDVLKAAGLQA